MNALSVGAATQHFDTEYETFLRERERLQGLFLASRFEMIEAAWRESGTEQELDQWLLRTPDLRRQGEGWDFWERTQPYRLFRNGGIWQILFTNSYDGLHDTRTRFVAAFNELLASKGMRTRLGDNGVDMYFQDVTHHRPWR